jgi:hypothetical protein
MQDPNNLNSKDLLQHLLANYEKGGINDQQIYEMERNIEQQMVKFDMTQREKTAQVVNDLSKIVITA